MKRGNMVKLFVNLYLVISSETTFAIDDPILGEIRRQSKDRLGNVKDDFRRLNTSVQGLKRWMDAVDNARAEKSEQVVHLCAALMQYPCQQVKEEGTLKRRSRDVREKSEEEKETESATESVEVEAMPSKKGKSLVRMNRPVSLQAHEFYNNERALEDRGAMAESTDYESLLEMLRKYVGGGKLPQLDKGEARPKAPWEIQSLLRKQRWRQNSFEEASHRPQRSHPLAASA